MEDVGGLAFGHGHVDPIAHDGRLSLNASRDSLCWQRIMLARVFRMTLPGYAAGRFGLYCTPSPASAYLGLEVS